MFESLELAAKLDYFAIEHKQCFSDVDDAVVNIARMCLKDVNTQE